jgi:hypothetical protein
MGQAPKHIAQIGIGVKAAPTATLDDGVDDGAALTRIGFSDEEPVFLADRRWTNRVLDEVMPPPILCRAAAWNPRVSAKTAGSDDCRRGIIQRLSK